MPNIDYKPEPLSKQFRRVWRENRGNWLLGIGLLVSLLGCMVGYFDLIPEIDAIDRPNFNSMLGGATLTVEISGCANDEGQVIAMLYDGRGFTESSVPLRLESVPILDQRARWDIHNLGYGSYAIYAFQDLDGNEVVDPKTERQGISISQEPSEGSAIFKYADAAFDFSPQQKSVSIELRAAPSEAR